MTGTLLRSARARIGWWFRPGLRCSFCGKPADAVGRLVAGVRGYICDVCINECVAVLEQHGGLAPTVPRR
jgi:hypothetical protein